MSSVNPFIAWDPSQIDEKSWFYRTMYNEYTNECDAWNEKVLSYEDYIQRNRKFLESEFKKIEAEQS